MKIIERIYFYLDYKGLKPTEFERACGISNGYLGKQYKRLADIGESILIKIIENCPEIDIIWLVTGKGEMLQTQSQEIQPPNEMVKLLLETVKEQAQEIGQLKQQISDLKGGRGDSSAVRDVGVAGAV